MRTKRIAVKHRILLEGYPNAGPNPNVRGMKEKYYGNDSYCVMCGKYIYFLGKTLDKKSSPLYNMVAN